MWYGCDRNCVFDCQKGAVGVFGLSRIRANHPRNANRAISMAKLRQLDLNCFSVLRCDSRLDSQSCIGGKFFQSRRSGNKGTRHVHCCASAKSAKEVAMAYYENYNAKRIDRILDLLADDCVYEDLVYQEPFKGREEIGAYLRKVEAMVPPDVKFVVEDVTSGDSNRVGVRWHVELEGGIVLPFSRGVSFYELNDKGQIAFARDVVEPVIKPGEAALRGISVVAPLIRKLGDRADPAILSKLPIGAILMASGWAVYIGIVLLSTIPPGNPAWQTSPEVLQGILHESYNFFYVNIALANVGLNVVPCIYEHPISEAIFNFVSAWSLMFWPVMVADPYSRKMSKNKKVTLWLGTMFLTNVFFPLYMSLRLLPRGDDEKWETAINEENTSSTDKFASSQPELPLYAPLIGGVSLTVGVVSLIWAVIAHPDLAGGMHERWEYFRQQASSDRVFWAFCLDMLLYYVWQAWLLGDAGTKASWHRWVPFFGMVGWLLSGVDVPPSTLNKKHNRALSQ